MSDPGNIDKRIKRHLLGKNRAFFISTLPGFELLCRDELISLNLSNPDFKITKGGIEFSGRVHECYLANLKLRTANRILMRLESFEATNFRQLDKHIAAMPWELYLLPDKALEVHVTTRHCRLYHTNAVADRFKAGIRQHFSCLPATLPRPAARTPFSQQIFVRALNDRLTVSIDSSGELLHKRGLKVHGGRAPLRETIAAAILLQAGYRGNETLVDPMCGAGTFSLEGAMIANHIPAGWYRDFAFMDWPCFKPSRWSYLRREARKQIHFTSRPSILASDKDRRACLLLKNTIADNCLQGTVSVLERDFFDLQATEILRLTGSGQKGLLVINPPYGRRLANTGNGKTAFMQICQKLKRDFKGWRFALLSPDRELLEAAPFQATAKSLFHGGLALILLTGKVQ